MRVFLHASVRCRGNRNEAPLNRFGLSGHSLVEGQEENIQLCGVDIQHYMWAYFKNRVDLFLRNKLVCCDMETSMGNNGAASLVALNPLLLCVQ